MHFDQRTQAALRSVGLSDDELQAASSHVVAATEAAAADLESFFDDGGTFYSDMDLAHSASDVAEHTIVYLDLFTHADDVRGYLRFDTWGVPVEGGRTLPDGTVELSLGPTVHGRVRFARERDEL